MSEIDTIIKDMLEKRDKRVVYPVLEGISKLSIDCHQYLEKQGIYCWNLPLIVEILKGIERGVWIFLSGEPGDAKRLAASTLLDWITREKQSSKWRRIEYSYEIMKGFLEGDYILLDLGGKSVSDILVNVAHVINLNSRFRTILPQSNYIVITILNETEEFRKTIKQIRDSDSGFNTTIVYTQS